MHYWHSLARRFLLVAEAMKRVMTQTPMRFRRRLRLTNRPAEKKKMFQFVKRLKTELKKLWIGAII